MVDLSLCGGDVDVEERIGAVVEVLLGETFLWRNLTSRFDLSTFAPLIEARDTGQGMCCNGWTRGEKECKSRHLTYLGEAVIASCQSSL